MDLRTHASLDEIPAAKWNALHDGSDPFISHAFLAGLERHGCLRPDWGWAPLHATLWDGDDLIAAAPGYCKTNSHGEFVFDQGWALAMERAGRAYYPKWLFAIPYTPVTGPRWLARTHDHKARLLDGIVALAARLRMVGIHANFLTDADCASIPESWLARSDVHFHWRNDVGWRRFDDHLAAMQSKKRKNIRHERQQVAAAGIGFRIVHGDEAGDDDIAAMHALYLRTFGDKGNSPALTLAFFHHLARTMPRNLVLILAMRAGTIVAGALLLRGGDTLHGRYWGSFQSIPGLHFETCYHQGIEYCLREGLRVFDPGAQGEHKLARGFLPVLTHSRHHLLEPGLDTAFARWCADERAASQRYRAALQAHSPYRQAAIA
ncbi:MAG: GNAT family N-acetyltransferase [Proteobacteria bacterium]|nr:GNAT family N-acetyltransferase [Pseudomonadota bacterium]